MKKRWISVLAAVMMTVMSTQTAIAGQWEQDMSRPANENGVSNWRYRNDDATYVTNQWEWIDRGDGIGECYCFNEEGWLFVSAELIEDTGSGFNSYFVDHDGKWTENGEIVLKTLNQAPVQATVQTAVYNGWEQDSTRPENDGGVSNWRYRRVDGTYVTNQWEWIDRGDGFGECYAFDENGWMYCDTSVPKGILGKGPGGAYYVMEDVYSVDENGKLTVREFVVFKQLDTSKSIESTLTDEEVYHRILALRSDYPEGMHWTNQIIYPKSRYELGGGCVAFVYIVRDAVFGVNGLDMIYEELDWDAIRAGDHIRYNHKGTDHSVIVLKKHADYLEIAEGNYNSSIHWGRKLLRSMLEPNFIFRETSY